MGHWPKWRSRGTKICDRVARGESLAQACGEAGMPSPRTFLAWVRQHPELEERWSDAKRALGQLRFDQAWELVRDLPDEGTGLKMKLDVLRWQATQAAAPEAKEAKAPKKAPIIFKRAQF